MKVLIADDDPVFRRLLQKLLERWGFTCSAVSNGEEALEELQRTDAPQLAVLDWMMPELDGVAVVRKLRESKSELYTYVLLLTGRHKKCDTIEALNAGCDDCLSKPFDPEELHARLFVGKRILELESRLQELLKATQHQATHDALTGINNRAAVLDALQRDLQRSSRKKTLVSVILLDLDHFKDVNDTYGHLAGDYVLHEAAARVKRSVRNYDIVGRFGGEEFLVVLPDCNMGEAASVAERITDALRCTPIRAMDQDLTVTASVGVATAQGGSDMQALLHAADCALYKAKSNGRDRVEQSTIKTFPSGDLLGIPADNPCIF